MIDTELFLAKLKSLGIRGVFGVPDSLLKDFCSTVYECKDCKHVTAANEGGAIGLAAGYHLATGTVHAS